MAKSFEWVFKLTGQCTSGKNAVIVTRTGKRFPAQRFVLWRKDMLEQIAPQMEAFMARYPNLLPMDFPISVKIEYTAKDRIKRDVPGIVDALWHLLEKVGIVTDDTYLAGYNRQLHFSNKGVDKNNNGVIITIKGNYDTNVPAKGRPSRSKRKQSRVGRRARKKIVGIRANPSDL